VENQNSSTPYIFKFTYVYWGIINPNFRKIIISNFTVYSHNVKLRTFNDVSICKFQMSGIQIAAPEGQCKLQEFLFYLSHRMTLKSLATHHLNFINRLYTILRQNWYCNIDLNTGSYKFRFTQRLLDFLPVTTKHCRVRIWKGQGLNTEKEQSPFHYLTPTLLQRLTMSLKAASFSNLVMIR
jgi:hypothetical protein